MDDENTHDTVNDSQANRTQPTQPRVPPQNTHEAFEEYVEEQLAELQTEIQKRDHEIAELRSRLDKRSETQDEQDQRLSELETIREARSKQIEQVQSRLTAVEVSNQSSGNLTDFGHITVHVDAHSKEKASRMNRIVEYMAQKAAETRRGAHSAEKWEIHEDVFDGDEVSERTVKRYAQGVADDVPGMKWGWPGEDATNERIDTNDGKRLKFSMADYQKKTE